jgi:hypothetical protein
MGSPINQVHGFPRFPNSPTPQSFLRRSAFLDGILKCFYGPGQPPDSGAQPGLDAEGNESIKVYQPPTDWAPVNAFLRIPQVVFLSKSVYQQLGLGTVALVCWTQAHYNYTTWGSTGPDGDCEGAYYDPTAIIWTQAELEGTAPITDSEQAEDARLTSLFEEVASRLTILRPGRTFVTYWSEWDIANPDSFGGPYGMDYTMRHLLAPPLTETVFLGTDFLHIYCGLPVYDNASRFSAGRVFAFTTTSPEDPTSFTPFNSSYARLAQAYPLFRRYAAWVYANRFDGNGIDWTANDGVTVEDTSIADESGDASYPQYPFGSYSYDFSAGPCSPVITWVPGGSPVANPFLSTDIPYFPSHFAVPDPIVGAPGPLIPDASIAAALAPVLSDQMATTNTQEETAGEWLKATCDLCSDFGVQFMGASTALTADDVVTMIAAWFGFDPLTGKDLPSP